MNTTPASPSTADEGADARRLLEEAQEHNRWNDDSTARRAQASAQMATGHVLLAMGTEIAAVRAQLDQLAGVRREIADLAGAVRELTATVAKSAASLPDIANAISDAPDHSEVLGDIATAVESLVTSVDDRSRRSWFGRRRSVRNGEVPA